MKVNQSIDQSLYLMKIFLEYYQSRLQNTKPEKEDPYDIPIIYWEEASLRLASTARVSKVTLLTKR